MREPRVREPGEPPDQGYDDDLGLTELLELARRHLGVDVVFVGRFEGGSRHFAAVAARDQRELAVLQGAAADLDQTYCLMIADGSLDPVTRDTQAHPVLAAMPVTAALDIGSYIGVTVRRVDGSLYGTVCCYSHHPDPHLTGRDEATLRFLADVIAHRVHLAESRRVGRERRRRHVEGLLESGEPDIVLQPIVSLASGATVGVEALSRFSLTEPATVFAQAHTVGLGCRLELQAVANALHLVQDVRHDVPVSINIGFDALMSDAFLDLADMADPGRVTWELTEHEDEIDRDRVVLRLARLRASGFRVALDDVGSGFSGLERVLRLQPEVIKLDRSIVVGVDHDAARAALIDAAMSFARKVGATIVAEGVETLAERGALAALGVEQGQGFALARPARLADLPTSVRAQQPA